jgi:hypothetical protein
MQKSRMTKVHNCEMDDDDDCASVPAENPEDLTVITFVEISFVVSLK